VAAQVVKFYVQYFVPVELVSCLNKLTIAKAINDNEQDADDAEEDS